MNSVEQLFLDDGWDTDEIWNLIVGSNDGASDNYIGTSGQDILMAGLGTSKLYGGDGKDIMIGDVSGNYKTVFELGNKDGADQFDKIADVIENFGAGWELESNIFNPEQGVVPIPVVIPFERLSKMCDEIKAAPCEYGSILVIMTE